jgi:hypothetical protein
MKTFFCFIFSIVAYLVLGLIAWNIVCSNMDVLSKTIEELAANRLYTYTGVTIGIIGLILIFRNLSKTDEILFACAIVLIINFAIALAVNYWEGIWDSVSIIFTIIYNLVNILCITAALMVSDK